MDNSKSKWYAIYTKRKKEDVVAFKLKNIGIGILNPKIKSKKYLRNRLLETIEPLFPGYIFANIDINKYFHLISYTRGVRYIVGKDNPIVVHEDIIRAINERMEENDTIVIRPQRFKKGEKVIVKDGPFKDFYGVFEREMKGPERVLIFLNAIYTLEIDSSFLKKI
ncbi:MAG: hypothetical protein IBX72_16195 [Nitrospirae bacterium]|nr:hypothetical protein [Nitrospirota bacterium]